nr:hypothetical protein [Pseudonocardia sp. AL041005-10]
MASARSTAVRTRRSARPAAALRAWARVSTDTADPMSCRSTGVKRRSRPTTSTAGPIRRTGCSTTCPSPTATVTLDGPGWSRTRSISARSRTARRAAPAGADRRTRPSAPEISAQAPRRSVSRSSTRAVPVSGSSSPRAAAVSARCASSVRTTSA